MKELIKTDTEKIKHQKINANLYIIPFPGF
jgi:hypothetical protein